MLALGLVSVLAFAGLVVDGSTAFAQRRQVQNAGDAASLAGASALNTYLSNPTTANANAIETAVLAVAETNGVDNGTVVCELVIGAGPTTQACPNTSNGLGIPANTYTVRATVTNNYSTMFMRAVGISTFDTNASADAAVLSPSGGEAPIMVCGIEAKETYPAGSAYVPIMIPPSGNPTAPFAQWTVNSAAIGVEYWVKGVEVKDTCGMGNNFKGLVDESGGPYPLPGDWTQTNGNVAGPARVRVRGIDGCADLDGATNCILVLPVCFPSTSSAMYCTAFGQFRVTASDANSIRAAFIGGSPVVEDGGSSGPPLPNAAHQVRLIK